jgi:flagellar assembly protein FliH
MVFQPFDGNGKIVSVGEPAEEAAPVTDVLPEIEVLPAEDVAPPPPPPPDFEALKAAAWTEGFQQGYDEGLRLATQEQQEISTRLGALLHDVAADNEALVRTLETQVIELALAVAEKVIAREAKIDPTLVLNVVRSALSEIHDATELRIHVNPDDYPLLETRWQEMLPRTVAERSELTLDELVERGGVIVETRIGYVDSQLKTRMNQVVTSFQAVLDGEPT